MGVPQLNQDLRPETAGHAPFPRARFHLHVRTVATVLFATLLIGSLLTGTAAARPHVKLVVRQTALAPEKVRFSTRVSYTASRVAFYVDGHRRWSERPRHGGFHRSGYLSTAKMASGRHRLGVRAKLSNGRVARTHRVIFVAKNSTRGGRKKTTTETTTEETTKLPSDLLFSGSHISDFLNQSAPGAVTEVPDPAGSGETVLQMTVRDTDVYPITPTENPRAQLVSPSIIDPGEEFWWHSKFFLPADFPSSVPGWLTVLEGPYGPPFGGAPPWHIEVSGSELHWQRNGTYNWDIPWQMPLVRNQWVDVLLHERFGTDGWVEMWINGQPVTFFQSGNYNPNHLAATQRLEMKTMDASNNGGPNSAYITNYRKAGMFETVTLFHGPLKLGTTRTAVGA